MSAYNAREFAKRQLSLPPRFIELGCVTRCLAAVLKRQPSPDSVTALHGRTINLQTFIFVAMHEFTKDNILPGLTIPREPAEQPSSFFRKHLDPRRNIDNHLISKVGLVFIPSHFHDESENQDPVQAHLIAVTDVLPRGKMRVVDSSRTPCIRRVSESGLDRRQRFATNNSGTHQYDGINTAMLTGTPLRTLEGLPFFESRILPDFEMKKHLSEVKLLELLDS